MATSTIRSDAWTQIGQCTGTTTATVTIDYTKYSELLLVLAYSTSSVYATSVVPVSLRNSFADARAVYITNSGDKRVCIFTFATKEMSMENSANTYKFILYAR